MKKIAIITNIPAPYRVDLFYYMQTHIPEYDFHIIYTNASEPNRNWSFNEEKCLNSYILSSKIIKRKNVLYTQYIHLTLGVVKLLRHLKPDVVIAFEYNPAAAQALFWCKTNRKKFIHLTDGTLRTERNIGKLQKLARQIIIKYADAYIASSTKAVEKLCHWGAPADRIFISLLTVDAEPYLKLKRDRKRGRILYVGEIVKRKGIDFIINALPYVKSDYTLHIVGNGNADEKAYLKALAEEKKVAGSIVWCGFKKKEGLWKEYSEADVFVFPTREDCFGLVLVEALAGGIPIISSPYAEGVYDLVEEGRNGMIVDPNDSKRLASAIDYVINNPDQMEQWGKYSKELIKKFKFEKVIDGYVRSIEFVNAPNI